MTYKIKWKDLEGSHFLNEVSFVFFFYSSDVFFKKVGFAFT